VPDPPEVRVPRLVGLMAVDARRSADARGVLLASPDRPDLHALVVDYVVRQYPPPDVEVPRGAVVTVWFGSGDPGGPGGPGDTEGGAGVREPRRPLPSAPGGVRRLDEPGDAVEVPG
jgi:hypothetical protein